MGKSGGGSNEQSGEIRYAPYIEDRHKELLGWESSRIKKLVSRSPFDGYQPLDIDPGFFGIGYVLGSFPSLYDMYGKFMAGLDVEYLFNQAFEDTTDGAIVHELISEQASELSHDLETETLPRYEVGMRDINAVMSGTFVVGKAMLESRRTREVSKFGAELRYKMIPIAVERWKTHLDWNKEVVATYAQIMQLYLKAYVDVGDHNYEMAAKDALWPFTLYEYQRSALGAIGGGGGVGGVAGSGPQATTGGKMMGGAMVGAAAGTQILPGWGTAIGAIVGAASGLL